MKITTQYVPLQSALYVGIMEPPDLRANRADDSAIEIVVQKQGKGITLIISKNEFQQHPDAAIDALKEIIGASLAAHVAEQIHQADTQAHTLELTDEQADEVRSHLSDFASRKIKQTPRFRWRRPINLAVLCAAGILGYLQTHKWQVALVYAFLAYSLVDAVTTNPRKFVRSFRAYRDLRPLMIPVALANVAAVLTVGSYLYQQLGFMRWNWFQYLSMPANNIIAAPLNYSSKWVSICFLLIIILLLPILAHMEEEIFRHGKHRWQQWVPASIIFGLVHITAGIPLAFAFALIISGLVLATTYNVSYRRRLKHDPANETSAEDIALRRSTALHTLSNTLIMSWVLVRIILG